jgi:hypothetical protein
MGAQSNGIKLEGKTLFPRGDPDTHFGKHILSQHIEVNAQKFDFTGIVPILDRISAAIVSHRAKYGAAEPVVA